MLRGWFMPGVRADGHLTADRAIVMVHGTRQNRNDGGAHELELSAALARRGFAILAFDMRGMGQSPAAPISFGHFESRDVEGAVDFLQSGPVPFSELGRPRILGALSMAQVVYGVDYFDSKPVAAVGRIAPRPLLLIHGSSDRYVPLSNNDELYAAATAPANARVTRWLVPGATHAQAFPHDRTEYLTRVVAFFDQALGPYAP